MGMSVGGRTAREAERECNAERASADGRGIASANANSYRGQILWHRKIGPNGTTDVGKPRPSQGCGVFPPTTDTVAPTSTVAAGAC